METTAKEMVKWKKTIFYSGGNTHQSSTCLTFLNRETENERISARERRAGGDVIFHLASVATRDVCGKLPLRVSFDYCTKVHSVWKRKRWLVQQ